MKPPGKKAETRRPKTEGNLTRCDSAIAWQDVEVRNTDLPTSGIHQATALNSDFGFRISFGLRPSAFGFPGTLARAFTLIELLIVIAIIAILAAMIIPISGAANRSKIRAKARVELEQVATAIELYKAKLGHYPPDNPGNPDINQLYFELLGTTVTNIGGQQGYVTLDGSAQVTVSGLATVFGLAVNGTARVGGIINCTQGGGGDEGRVATPFLSSLKPDEIATVTSPADPLNRVRILVAAVPPVGRTNTISYVSSSPTNNPNSYDLWVDVVMNGKTNRLSNWSKEAITLP